MVLRDGDELALAQAGRVLDDLLRAASGAVCEEGTEGRTSGDHQVRAVDELGDDGRGRGEVGEEVGAFPQCVYFDGFRREFWSMGCKFLTCWYQSIRVLPKSEPERVAFHREVGHLSRSLVGPLHSIYMLTTYSRLASIRSKLLVV